MLLTAPRDMCCSLQERCKKTLTPNWDEDKWLLVQEPKTQAMRLQCFDHDALNVKVCTTCQSPAQATPPYPKSFPLDACSAADNPGHFSVVYWRESFEAGLVLMILH